MNKDTSTASMRLSRPPGRCLQILNEIDATYVDTVLMAMAKWQKDITLTITDMCTDDCVVWDAKRNAIDEATQKFGQTCEASHIKCAAAREAHQRAVVKCDERDPVIKCWTGYW